MELAERSYVELDLDETGGAAPKGPSIRDAERGQGGMGISMELKTGGQEAGVGLVGGVPREFEGERDGAARSGALPAYEAARDLEAAQKAGQNGGKRACGRRLQKQG